MVDLTFSDAELTNRRTGITAFIEETVEAAGATGTILGLSGGVDSALTAALAVEALGPERVTTVAMPAAVSDQRHVTDAREHAAELGVAFDVIEIEPIVNTFIDRAPIDDVGEEPRGNARARVRAVMSYLFANEAGLVVLGTGNRTEALVGYFTKYGDGAVDCHPIGNLYKCQVRQLARAVGVPEVIVEKTPTAELWADQTDEGELGIDYDTLDRILALHIDGPLSVSQTAGEIDCDPALVERAAGMVAGSAHKRTTPTVPP